MRYELNCRFRSRTIAIFAISVLAILLVTIFGYNEFGVGDKANAKQLRGETQMGTKLTAPVKGIYHGAFTNFGGTEDEVSLQNINDFQKIIGKKIIWAMFSDNWGKEGIKFPEKNAMTIHSLGIVPFIRMMPRSDFAEGKIDPEFTLKKIIDGKFDYELRKWANDAKKIHIPMIVEFGPEMNGNWFPWSGILNGGGKKDGYGDTELADGPEKFKDAYRHIINLFEKQGADNITWVFHVFPPVDKNEDGELHKKWNNVKNYYPGDKYIDWIGVSVYGAVEPDSEWRSFIQVMNKAYPVIAGISAEKPLGVFEFGVAEYPHLGNKTEWIRDALESLEADKYPRIKAISYWDELWNHGSTSKVIDLRINSSTMASQAYKQMLKSPYFLSQAEFKTSSRSDPSDN